MCDPSVKEDHKCMKGLSRFPGEIDTLAIFQKNKKIFLAEAKHTTLNISALDISKEIKKYTDKKTGYEVKLLKKKAFIEKNIKHILNCYGILDTEGWDVDCLFVSNTFQFAVPGLTISLLHVDDLSSHLDDNYT